MPDEELLYDLADLFKVFSDTTRIKILYCPHGRRAAAWPTSPSSSAPRRAPCRTSCASLKQARLVQASRRDGKNVIYSLADDHVYTMLSPGHDAHLRVGVGFKFWLCTEKAMGKPEGFSVNCNV